MPIRAIIRRRGVRRGLGLPSTIPAYDSMESYVDGVFLNGLTGRTKTTARLAFWNKADLAYVDRSSYIGIQVYDLLDTYTDGVVVNGIGGGHWPVGQNYVDRDGDLWQYAVDNMESYTDSAAVNNLNGGTKSASLGSVSWTGPYVDPSGVQQMGSQSGDVFVTQSGDVLVTN